MSYAVQVLHPNITDQGQICLDIIADAWNPAVSNPPPSSVAVLCCSYPVARTAPPCCLLGPCEIGSLQRTIPCHHRTFEVFGWMLASQMHALGPCILAVSLFALHSLSLNFSPSLILQVSLRQIILSLHTLFTDPNPSNPVSCVFELYFHFDANASERA